MAANTSVTDQRVIRLRKLAGIAVLLALLGGGGVFLSVMGVGIPCLFHLATGLDCPGCGVTRVVTALLKGDLTAAWRHNPLVLILSPFLLILMTRLSVRWVQSGDKRLTKAENRVAWTMILCLLLFGIIRNTGFYPY